MPSKMSLRVRFPMVEVMSKRITLPLSLTVRFENNAFTISFVSMNVGKQRLATTESQQ